jgi:hypothetical protein
MPDAVEQIQELVAQGYSPVAAASIVGRGGGGTTAPAQAPLNDVDAAIQATAGKAGMDVPSWRAIAHIESGLKPGSNAYNPGTQYKGLFQIGSRGSQSEWALHGNGNIYNPMDNANAAASLAAKNNAWFQNRYNRAPSPIETYMMHQQGPGFYSHGTMTNIAGNTPKGYPIARTPQEFESMWGGILAKRAGADPSTLYPNESVASSTPGIGGGGGGTSGAPTNRSLYVPSGADNIVGSAAPPSSDATSASLASSTPDTSSAPGVGGGGVAGILGQMAKQSQANTPPPMQLQMPNPITPAMLRARAMAQAMINQPLGITGSPTGGPTS